jgi:hypothetical protein
MSYQLYDSNGYVGDLATNTGLDQLSNYLLSFKVKAISKFINQGESLNINRLIKSLKKIPASDDKDIQNTLDNLINLLGKCEEIAIISDGIEPDVPEKIGLSSWKGKNSHGRRRKK